MINERFSIGLKISKKKYGITTCLLFISLCNLYAQDTVSLSRAIQLAIQKSFDITIAKNNIEVASILNSYGFAGGLPLVTANVTDNESITSVNQKLNTGTNIQRNNAAANALNGNVAGSILVFNAGRVKASKQRLGALQTQSGFRLDTEIQNIIANVSTAYYDIVRQQNYIKTIDKSIDASNQQLMIINTRKSVGLANNADLFQAQIDFNALQQNRQQQLLVIAQAKTELLRLLTAPADSSIEIKDSIVLENKNNISLQTILTQLKNNSDIKIADEQILINKIIVKEIAALRYPSLRANAGFNFIRNQAAAGQLLLNQSYGPTIGVGVSIPIFNGGIFKKQSQVANIDIKNATLQKDILWRDYKAQVTSLYQSYVSTIAQIETEKENYKLSSQLLDLVLQRFQLRQATIVEVKNAQQSFEQSGFRLINLNFAAKASEIQLKKLGNLLTI